ncbi:MAG: hypothetical protein KDA31_02060 [Phycisphaerales bacterium]|nr:hypothetical protein [Phycisphaerales bacterium]MCB9835161.1 hypothetical protein [Phycisphaera sp.]
MTGDYLKPYEEAVESGGTGFESLLWKNRQYQQTRFRVICEVASAGLNAHERPADLNVLSGRVIADMGAGRADMLRWLVDHRVEYGRFVAVEGVAELAQFCRERIASEKLEEVDVIEGDFAADADLFESLVRSRGVELVCFSGSLNTFEQDHAVETIRRAFHAVKKNRGAVVFNFLSDLVHHPPSGDTGPARRFDTTAVFATLAKLTPRIILRHDYLEGHDATIGLFA